MDARLLTGLEEERFREIPDLSPQANLTDPRAALTVQPGPVGAQFLTEEEPASAPMAAAAAAPSPAQTIAQPKQPAGSAAGSQWTPERKQFANKINETARRYRAAVEARRAQRKEVSAYGKLKSQLEASAGQLQDLKNMEATYKDVYTPDSAATMAIQKRQAEHFEKVQRLRQELNRQASQLSKQYGFKLGQHGGLEDEDSLADAGDAEFDDQAREAMVDAYMSQYPQ